MPDEPPEIEQWLAGLRSGDPDAMAALFEFYRPRLKQVVRMRFDRRLSARVDESDVLQDAYVDANRQIAVYLREPRVSFYVWLRGLTLQRLSNVQRDHVTAQRRSVRREFPLPKQSSVVLAQKLLAAGPTPSEAVARSELRQCVQQALEKLKPSDREVILMVHFEDMSCAQVGQVMGLSRTAATMRYARALTRLREFLISEVGESQS